METAEITPTVESEVTPQQEPQATEETIVENKEIEAEGTEEVVTAEEQVKEGSTEPEETFLGTYKTKEDAQKGVQEKDIFIAQQGQQIADLTKQVEELEQLKEPKLIDDTGNISQEFKQQHQFDVDNKEYLAYDQLSRSITDIETRQQVETLLRDAKGVYQYDKGAYKQYLDEVKQFFAPSIIEQIAKNKLDAESQFKQQYDAELAKSKAEKANNVAKKIESTPELYKLVNQESENFSPEVFTIVKQIFDKYGDVDTDITTKAIESIKALGVKEHLAQQKLEATKQSATVPTGNNVKEVKTDLPTAKEIAENPAIYTEAVKKYGMEKIDEIIKKG